MLSQGTYVNWTPISENKPYNGFIGALRIIPRGDNGPLNEYWYDIGTYCEGDWYKLEYDDTLGTVVKVPVHGKIDSYSPILVLNQDM